MDLKYQRDGPIPAHCSLLASGSLPKGNEIGNVMRMKNSCRWMVLLLLALACAGTDQALDAGLAAVVRDSAGVQLVHNRDATVDTAAAQLVEISRLGVVDGDENLQFDRIGGIATDDLGRLFVIDQGTRAVRVFDSNGRFVRRFGGAGRGPGEFTHVSVLFRWRDTIHVADVTTFRGALFDTTGGLLLPYKSLLPDGTRLEPVAAGPKGWYFRDDTVFGGKSREQLGIARQTAWVTVRLDPRLLPRALAARSAADSLIVPITQQLRPRVFGTLGSEDGRTTMVLGNFPFFEPRPARAVDSLGRSYLAAGWPYRIDVHDVDGRLIHRITRAHDSIPVTPELTAEVLRRAKSYYDTTAQRGGATMRTYNERAKLPMI